MLSLFDVKEFQPQLTSQFTTYYRFTLHNLLSNNRQVMTIVVEVYQNASPVELFIRVAALCRNVCLVLQVHKLFCVQQSLPCQHTQFFECDRHRFSLLLVGLLLKQTDHFGLSKLGLDLRAVIRFRLV